MKTKYSWKNISRIAATGTAVKRNHQRIAAALLLGLFVGSAQADYVWDGGSTGVWEEPNNWWDGSINRIPSNDGVDIRPRATATITYSDTSGTNILNNNTFWQDSGADHHTMIQTGGDLQVKSLYLSQLKTNTNAPAYTISGGKLTAGSVTHTWANSGSLGCTFLQTGGEVVASTWSMALKRSTQEAFYDLQDGSFTVNAINMGNGSLNPVAAVNQSGGIATVNSYIRMGYNVISGGSSIYNLDGGTLTIKNNTDPLRFVTATGPWIQTSGPSYVKEGDGWRGPYWAVIDSDPGPAEEWVAEQQLNQWLQQVWTNTVTQTGDVTLGFDLALNGDSGISFCVVGWRKDVLGVGDDSNGNALQGNGWNIACDLGYVADVLLGTSGNFFTNLVTDGNEKVQKYYNQSAEGTNLTVALDPDVDLSQYDYIGINIFGANYGVQVDNISLTTADGGVALIDVPGFDKADLEPLAPGSDPSVYFDFDGGTLNLKGTWDYASLTGIVASDFRAKGVAITEDSLTFKAVDIGGVAYTEIEAVSPSAGTVFLIK